MTRYDLLCLVAVAAFVLAMVGLASEPSGGLISVVQSPATAAWVQAIGGIGAVVAALLIGESQFRQHNRTRLEDTRLRTTAAMRSAFWVCTFIRSTAHIADGEAKKKGFAPGVPAALSIQASTALDILKTVSLADLADNDAVNAVLNFQQVAAALLAKLAYVEKTALVTDESFRTLVTSADEAGERLNYAMDRFQAG